MVVPVQTKKYWKKSQSSDKIFNSSKTNSPRHEPCKCLQSFKKWEIFYPAYEITVSKYTKYTDWK